MMDNARLKELIKELDDIHTELEPVLWLSTARGEILRARSSLIQKLGERLAAAELDR